MYVYRFEICDRFSISFSFNNYRSSPDSISVGHTQDRIHSWDTISILLGRIREFFGTQKFSNYRLLMYIVTGAMRSMYLVNTFNLRQCR